MNYEDHIEINPKIMMGKPVIKGTRITVESILEKLSAGETEADILVAHPHLSTIQIKAALEEHLKELSGSFTVIQKNAVRIKQKQ